VTDDRSALDGALDRAAGGGVVEVDRGSGRARVHVVEADRLGVKVSRVGVTRTAPVDVAAEAERLAGGVRALPDRLAPVEVAPALGGAILRTRPEDLRRREFFEVQVAPGETVVSRHRVDAEGRTPVDFTLTRDQLDGLLDDLSGTRGRD
jgi:hypothetical protein